MPPTLLSPAAVRKKIEQGKALILAGEEALLRQLPRGRWIGGTLPSGITAADGAARRDTIQVTELPEFIERAEIRSYSPAEVPRVYCDAPENGVSFIIIPAKSDAHFAFALNAPNFELFAVRPLIGWISGIDPEQLHLRSPKVFAGTRPASSLDNAAIVMHVSLPPTKVADIGIINIFEQGNGDVITFPQDGFRTRTAFVNGRERNFAEYLQEARLDTRLPLVADYHGVLINASFRIGSGRPAEVEFYAPVFSGVRYKHARPVADYLGKFTARAPEGVAHQVVFSCNCILNDRLLNPQGKTLPGITGPTTCGEIAYLLLNQTMVYLRIIDLPAGPTSVNGTRPS